MTSTNRDLTLEALAIIRLGSRELKLQYLKKPRLSDAARLAFKDDADPWIRESAVRNAKRTADSELSPGATDLVVRDTWLLV